MKQLTKLQRWMILFSAILCLFFQPTPGVYAQQPTTITGTFYAGTFGSENQVMTFDPNGGPITLETKNSLSNGPVCNTIVTLKMEGTFAGGDGGVVSGTYIQTFASEPACPGLQSFTEYPGIWTGNFYADGTGSGLLYDDKGVQQPNGWFAVFSAEEFQAALSGTGDNSVEPVLPVEPGEVIPNQTEQSTDQTVPMDTTDTGGLFGIPIPIILGSLGIPIAGAAAGAVLSALLSGLSSAAVSSPGAIPAPVAQANDQGLYWSERPWDEAGPGYVSKEEYELTKDMLGQGYKWTKDGWQTPDQITESKQIQQNNQEAVAREDEQFLNELEKNKQSETPQQDLRTFDMKLGDFQEDLYGLRDELEKTNYVLNPWQGDPTILIHKGITVKNMVYDATIGQFTGKQGLTCGDYVEKTVQKSNEYLQKHFPGASVESVIFEEQSSQADAKGFMNWLDSCVADNHNLLRVTLPDGSKLAVDFHQNRAGKAPLIRKWDEARKEWRDYLGGSEFIERTSFTMGGK